MVAINAMLFKLAYKILAAIFADNSSHGSTAFWPGQSSGEVDMDFCRSYSFFGSGRLNVNEGNLFKKDYHPVFQCYCFHGHWSFVFGLCLTTRDDQFL